MELNIKNNEKDTSKTFEIDVNDALETAVKAAASVVGAAKFFAMYKFISTGFDIVALMNDNKIAKTAIKFGGRCIAANMACKVSPNFRKALKNVDAKVEGTIDGMKETLDETEEQGDS